MSALRDSASVPAGPLADLRDRRREQRSWYVYDWANSAYVTVTGTVLFGPYLTVVAERAACPDLADGAECTATLPLFGFVPVTPGALVAYLITISTVAIALLLPFVGVLADRSPRKRTLMARFAWAGAVPATAMVVVAGDRWALGAVLLVVANACLAASLTVYDSILVDIAAPDERDRVSSRGWAVGYAAGFVLLALNLAVLSSAEAVGLGQEWAVRLGVASAGVWWGLFTLVPYLGLRDRPAAAVGTGSTDPHPGLLRATAASVRQLGETLREARRYPRTLLFLAAYLLFNDGVQTVIGVSAIFGAQELGLATGDLVLAILVVQGVAFFGALGFGLLASRTGTKAAILVSLVLWTAVVGAGYALPAGDLGAFVGLAAGIGLVLGGTQALSRSLYSQLVPPGRQGEYFALYQAGERGTSWFGTLTFGLVQQATGSYRLAIVAVVAFFVAGGLLLWRVDVRQGILDAGNEAPPVT